MAAVLKPVDSSGWFIRQEGRMAMRIYQEIDLGIVGESQLQTRIGEKHLLAG